MYMLGHSYVSLAGALLLLITAITFVPNKVSRKRRVLIGILHVSAHLASALILMLLMELGVETCIRHNLLGTSGESISSIDCEVIVTGLRWHIISIVQIQMSQLHQKLSQIEGSHTRFWLISV